MCFSQCARTLMRKLQNDKKKKHHSGPRGLPEVEEEGQQLFCTQAVHNKARANCMHAPKDRLPLEQKRTLKPPSCVVPMSSRADSKTRRMGMLLMRSLSHSTCQACSQHFC